MRLTAMIILSTWLCGANVALSQSNLAAETLAEFDAPWAVAALPKGGFLVTEKQGQLRYVAPNGDLATISGGPRVDAAGQVGLHDVALAPDFDRSGLVYLTWVAGTNGGNLHLGRGRLDGMQLMDFTTLWRAAPEGGGGHPGAMIAFSKDGHLFLTTGDRQLGDPAQDLVDSRGKILRLTLDGQTAQGNPFPNAPEVWSYGHRNPYGLVFDSQGRLWSHEMGPRGGDELNLIAAGQNYGWPLVSEGRTYGGRSIPDHATRPEFVAPQIAWSPVIAPAGMVYYDGAVFPSWRGSLLIGGLQSEGLVQVKIDGAKAVEAGRWNTGSRIRDVATDAAGHVYLLEDNSRLLRLTQGK